MVGGLRQVWILSAPWDGATASRTLVSRAGTGTRVCLRVLRQWPVTRCVAPARSVGGFLPGPGWAGLPLTIAERGWN